MPASSRRSRATRVELGKAILTDLKFSRNRKRSTMLGFTLSRPTSPADAYSYNTRTRKLTRWTYSEVGGLNTDFFIEPTLINYPTFDETEGKRRTVPAFYYKPSGDGPYPVMVFLHGGPHSQFRPRFNALFQYLALEAGVAIIAPNVRGSAGQGKSYARLDNHQRRDDAVSDVGALLDWIEQHDELDAGQVIVYGRSYGGFLTLAAMARYGKRIRSGIASKAMTYLPSFLKNAPDHLHSALRAEYGDLTNTTTMRFLKKISPLAQHKHIRAPLLVIHGAKDKRVRLQQSQRLVSLLRARKQQVWSLVANTEGHCFVSRKNKNLAQTIVALFLAKTLSQ